MTALQSLYDQMETQARQDGLTRADAEMTPGGRLHQWIWAHCRYRPDTEWFLLFELACRLGKGEIPLD